jgi:8-oxo-dGTP pyrophosphatase MutT (NUDIX family)
VDTATDNRLSCGAVVVRETDSGWLTLMLRAYRNWDFPKGMREEGESPLEAAIREVGEETGIDDLEFRWGEKYMDTGPYSRGKVARYYLAASGRERIVMGISPETGQPEHHEARWMSFDEAYDITSPRVRDVVQWARNVLGA